MSVHLSKDRDLLVVSDTGMIAKNGKMFAFGPVVKELEEMLSIFKSITWIGFNRPDQVSNDSYVEISSDKIQVIALKRVGGKSIIDKLNIVSNYPMMWHIILSEIKKHQYIHCRAPSNPAYISMLLSKNFPDKQFWFKYAGNWIDKTSFFYNLQRKRLKKNQSNYKVTVNGTWKYQPKHVLAFENPCITERDRKIGKEIVRSKELANKINYCFVGGLNENKGVLKIMEALTQINNSNLGVIHIVGDGVLKELVEKKALKSRSKIILHGFISKIEIVEIYKVCHFIILPSKSEGFPKVIGEAMNYGCIPIVSDVSCIGQYIKNDINGILIKPINVKEIKIAIVKSLNFTRKEFNDFINVNFKLTNLFTYNYYIKRIIKEIF